jgi:nucleotide-binding universal stress UspA family protein
MFDSHMRKAEAQSTLDVLVARLQETGIQVDAALQEGRSEQCILQFASDQDIDLIVLNRHGDGAVSDGTISGSSHQLMLRSPISTLLVPPDPPASAGQGWMRYHRILAPLDRSQRAAHVLPLATRLAQAHDAELIVAHVVQRPAILSQFQPSQEDEALTNRLAERNQEEATAYLARLQSESPSHLQTRLLVSDHIAFSLHELVKAENIDLVVMSAHGQSCQTQWPYGHVTSNFLLYGTTSLLIVQDLLPHQRTPTAVTGWQTYAPERSHARPLPEYRRALFELPPGRW